MEIAPAQVLSPWVVQPDAGSISDALAALSSEVRSRRFCIRSRTCPNATQPDLLLIDLIAKISSWIEAMAGAK